MSIQTVADAFATRDTAGEAAATSTGERYYLHGNIIAEWLDTTTVRLYRPEYPTSLTARHLTAIATAVAGVPCTVTKAVLVENDTWTMTVSRRLTRDQLVKYGKRLVDGTIETLNAPRTCGLTDTLIALRVWADEWGYDFDAADSASLTAASKIGRGELTHDVLLGLHAFHVGD